MDRVFSARLDEATLDEMARAVRRLGITKKRFLEEAIRRHVGQLPASGDSDVWGETLGAWRRREHPATTVRKARRAVQQAFERRHRDDARLHRQ